MSPDSPEAEPEYNLTPRTEAKYSKIDEEFQMMMQRNQLNGSRVGVGVTGSNYNLPVSVPVGNYDQTLLQASPQMHTSISPRPSSSETDSGKWDQKTIKYEIPLKHPNLTIFLWFQYTQVVECSKCQTATLAPDPRWTRAARRLRRRGRHRHRTGTRIRLTTPRHRIIHRDIIICASSYPALCRRRKTIFLTLER